MALAIDASSPAHAAGTAGNPATTASFTPPSGSLLVAMVTANGPSGIDMSCTVTGGGLSWTRRVARIAQDAANSTGGVAGRDGTTAEIWTAVGAGASMTVSADQDNGLTPPSHETGLQVQVLTDSSTPGIGNVGHAINASGAPSCNVASVTAGSYVFGVAADWSNSGTGTAQTGETMIATSSTADYSRHYVRSTSTAGAGTYTIGVSAPATQDYNLAALEVLATPSAPSTIAFVKNGGTVADKAPVSTDVTVTVPAGGHAAGNLVVVGYSSQDLGPSPTVITDSRGNSYQRHSQSPTATAATAVGGSVLTTALQAGDTITVTFTSTPTEAVVITREFSGATFTKDVDPGGASGSSATPTVSVTPVSAVTLLVAMLRTQGPSGDSFTEDADAAGGAGWTGLRVGSTGGGATSNITGNLAHKITTSAVAQTYDPSITSRAWRTNLTSLQAQAQAAAVVVGRVPHRGLRMRGRT